ncbi:MAG: hypothetical protein P4M08_06965 [Oligoflexia bacterium]|nr:hypothetical protein [Oligoflexia bacterium]
MPQNDFDLLYFASVLRRRGRLLGSIVVVTVLAFCALYAVLPKKYKSAAEITIYSRYFQNPLIRDFISEQYDTAEMRTQREALLQQAVDDGFLDQVASEFHLYRTPEGSPRRGGEREDLRRHFEIFGINADSYQIGFVSNRPEIAEAVAKRTLERVIETLIDERRKTLINVRDAIRARMQAMALVMNTGPNGLSAASRAQLESQLAQVQSQIASLLEQYTEKHPKVVQLRARERSLEEFLKRPASGQANRNLDQPEALAGAEVEPGTKDVYQDLLKKYNYLSVALDMEQANSVNYYAVVSAPSFPLSPIAPKLFNMVGYGLGAGILIALFALLFEEYLEFNAANIEKKAKFWGVPLLGVLPRLDWELAYQSGRGELKKAVSEENLEENLEEAVQPNDWH